MRTVYAVTVDGEHRAPYDRIVLLKVTVPILVIKYA